MYFNYTAQLDHLVGHACPMYVASGRKDVTDYFFRGKGRRANAVRLPLDPPDPWELTVTKKAFYSEECHHPCLVMDLFFDAHMLGQTEFLLCTSGSLMSDLAYRLQKKYRKASDRLRVMLSSKSEDHESIDSYVRRKKSFGKDKFEGSGRSTRAGSRPPVDLLGKDGRQAALLALPGSPSLLPAVLSLLAIHPSAFFYYHRGDPHRPLARAQLLSCSLPPGGLATPGLSWGGEGGGGENSLAWVARAACEQRPVRIQLVPGRCRDYAGRADLEDLPCSEGSEALLGTARSTGRDTLSGGLGGFGDFVQALRAVQRFFGLDDILEERTILQWWW